MLYHLQSSNVNIFVLSLLSQLRKRKCTHKILIASRSNSFIYLKLCLIANFWKIILNNFAFFKLIV